jgi:hypothetical protein
MDAVVFVPLSAVVTVGAAALNELGIAAAAANVTSKRKFRRIMLPSLKWLLSIALVMLHSLGACLKGGTAASEKWDQHAVA